jgi:hypothetical protein
MSKQILNLTELVSVGVDHIDRGQVSKVDAVLTIQKVYFSKGITISWNTVNREFSRQLKATKLERDNLMRLNKLYLGEQHAKLN